MVIQNHAYPTRAIEHMLGGEGRFEIEDILQPEQMHGKGRLFARGTLQPGHSVGYHVHEKDMEICFFLSGTGIVEDETGTKTAAQAGDTNIVDVGHGHTIVNTGTQPLQYLAVILYA